MQRKHPGVTAAQMFPSVKTKVRKKLLQLKVARAMVKAQPEGTFLRWHYEVQVQVLEKRLGEHVNLLS